jgi:hypothetical protein
MSVCVLKPTGRLALRHADAVLRPGLPGKKAPSKRKTPTGPWMETCDWRGLRQFSPWVALGHTSHITATDNGVLRAVCTTLALAAAPSASHNAVKRRNARPMAPPRGTKVPLL